LVVRFVEIDSLLTVYGFDSWAGVINRVPLNPKFIATGFCFGAL
jgi:hypothetical protein